MESIQHLEIGGAKITDAGMVHVAKMPNLQSLGIYPSDVSNTGILKLKPLLKLEQLSVGPYVTEDAATQLWESMPRCHIDAWDKAGTNSFNLSK